jgi:ubiquitin carboxyl-terminal hydrolase 7
VIGVFHFSKDLPRTHGVPFKFVVKRGEKFADTKKRLQARIGVSDKDLAKYRFALIQVSTFKQPSYIEDGKYSSYRQTVSHLLTLLIDDTIYEHQFAPEDVLGLDHVDKSGKPRSGVGEKALTIR